MGLDMYWVAKKTPEEKAEALITGEDPYSSTEIGYFRNFHSLFGYMSTMYPEEIRDINTVELAIGEHELVMMRAYMPPVDFLDEEELGFWHENSNKLLLICDRIEEALKEGREVVYWPWW